MTEKARALQHLHFAGPVQPVAGLHFDRRETFGKQRIEPRQRFGDEVFDDDGYRDWVAADADREVAQQLGYEQSPEYVALPTLVPAWEAGLIKVVTIPCRDEFTRVIGPNALLVTAGTRDDPERYAAALGAFVDAAR